MKKIIVLSLIILFLGLTLTPCVYGDNTKVIKEKEKIETTSENDLNLGGSLSGYVTDLFKRPIKGAKVNVFFHGTNGEDYTDSEGYYHISNISICRCLKDVTISKVGFKTKIVSLSIYENSTFDLSLKPSFFY